MVYDNFVEIYISYDMTTQANLVKMIIQLLVFSNIVLNTWQQKEV